MNASISEIQGGHETLDTVKLVVSEVHSQMISADIEYHKQNNIIGQDGKRYLYVPQRADMHDLDVHNHHENCLSVASAILNEKSNPFKKGGIREEIFSGINTLLSSVNKEQLHLVKVWAYTHDMGKYFEPTIAITTPNSQETPNPLTHPTKEPRMLKRNNPSYGKIVPPLPIGQEQTRESEEDLTVNFWRLCKDKSALSADELKQLESMHEQYSQFSHRLKYSKDSNEPMNPTPIAIVLTAIDELGKSKFDNEPRQPAELEKLNSIIKEQNGRSI